MQIYVIKSAKKTRYFVKQRAATDVPDGIAVNAAKRRQSLYGAGKCGVSPAFISKTSKNLVQ